MSITWCVWSWAHSFPAVEASLSFTSTAFNKNSIKVCNLDFLINESKILNLTIIIENKLTSRNVASSSRLTAVQRRRSISSTAQRNRSIDPRTTQKFDKLKSSIGRDDDQAPFPSNHLSTIGMAQSDTRRYRLSIYIYIFIYNYIYIYI